MKENQEDIGLSGWQKQLRQIEAQISVMQSHRSSSEVHPSPSLVHTVQENSICQDCLRAQIETWDVGTSEYALSAPPSFKYRYKEHQFEGQARLHTKLDMYGRWDECDSGNHPEQENRAPTTSSRCSQPFPKSAHEEAKLATAAVQVNLLTPSKGEKVHKTAQQMEKLAREVR